MRRHVTTKYFAMYVKAQLTLIMLVVVFVMSGCAGSKLSDTAWQDEGLNIIWPQPPERARIKLLKVIDGPGYVADNSRSPLGRFIQYMVGTEEKNIDFFTPQCIAADGNGLMYIADPSIGLIHRYDLAAKEVQYLFEAGDKKLGSPVGVALDADGSLYVTDALHAAVYKFGPNGKLLRELDGKGNLKRPAGIAITSSGEKIIADILANKVFIFGKDDVLKRELPGSDFKESFNRPTYIALDRSDNMYVTDSMNFTIRVFDGTGKYIKSVGQIGDAPGAFARPKGIAVDSDQNLYVLDSIFANFQIFNQKDQLLLYVGQEGSRPGEMMLPSGIFIDKNDRIYVADTFNHRIMIYQYLKEGAPK